jgi:transcriptional antiterminator RfaH
VTAKLWYVVRSKPGQENIARLNLERQQYEVFWPHQCKETIRHGKRAITYASLFVSYVFVHLDLVTERWHPIRNTIGVSRMILDGERPAPVRTQKIGARAESLDELRGRADKSGLLPSDDPVIEQLALEVGKLVEILDGPFAGLEAIYRGRKNRDVVVEISLLSGKTDIALPPDVVAPLPAGAVR